MLYSEFQRPRFQIPQVKLSQISDSTSIYFPDSGIPYMNHHSVSLLGPILSMSQVLKNGRSLPPEVENATNGFLKALLVWMTKMYHSGIHKKISRILGSGFPDMERSLDEVCTSSWFTFSRGIVYMIEILYIRRIRKVIVIGREGRKIDSIACNSHKDEKSKIIWNKQHVRFLVAPFSISMCRIIGKN